MKYADESSLLIVWKYNKHLVKIKEIVKVVEIVEFVEIVAHEFKTLRMDLDIKRAISIAVERIRVPFKAGTE
jgi:hypothetical protein